MHNLNLLLLLCTGIILLASSLAASSFGRLTTTRGPKACQTSQFPCKSGQRCIPKPWTCDGDPDCPDGSDEDPEYCSKNKICAPGEFSCKQVLGSSHSKCIPERWKCDGENDCPDGSDENLSECKDKTCHPQSEFQCNGTGICIPNAWKCDGAADCPNGTDEDGCPAQECGSHDWKCLKSGRCIFDRWRCDHDLDCGGDDDSDEVNCTKTCATNEFKCATVLQCVPSQWVCDGDKDCPDHSDEANCTRSNTVSCTPNEWACNDGRCIHSDWKCDGDFDCPDESDEDNCGGNSSCAWDHFKCKTKHECIPISLQCNGVPECEDKSDEENCTTSSKPTVCNPADHFDCGNGQCILWTQVCDKKMDCNNGVDEEPHAKCDVNECAVNKGNCSHECENLPDGFRCICPVGFKLAADNRTCEDIDECKDNVCSQNCTNTVGSYKCRCYAYFVPQKDGKTCRALGDDPKLLIANRVTIREFDLVKRRFVHLITDLDSAVAMDFVYQTHTIIWSDVSKEKIMKCEIENYTAATLQSGGFINASSCIKTLVGPEDVKTPDGLAVDWMHKLLYWTDTGLDKIFVVTLDGKYKKTLIQGDMDEPRAIALDPSEGVLFWTDWGHTPKIEAASMDGTHRKVIINSTIHPIQWPNGLAVDILDKRIYWADARLKTIYSADYLGNDRKTVLMDYAHLKHPFSLAVFEERIYWTDWDTDGVHSANKVDGKGISQIIYGLYGPMTIKIYQEHTQPSYINNKCDGNGCSHLCLPRAKNSWLVAAGSFAQLTAPYSCSCPDQMDGKVARLHQDGRRCFTGDEKDSIDESPEENSHDAVRSDERPKQTGHITAVVVVILGTLSLIVAVFGWISYRRMQSRPGNGLNFDNPVYRNTTQAADDPTDFLESSQYNPVIGFETNGHLSFANSLTEPLTKSSYVDDA